MKRIITSFALIGTLAPLLVFANDQTDTEILVQGNKKTDTRKILLEVEADVVTFGSYVPLKVSYQNHGETAWELNERGALQDTLIQFILSESHDESPSTISWLEIAGTRHREQGIRSLFRPPTLTPLTIAPGDKFDFTVVLASSMFFRHFTAGEHYTIWIMDAREKMESNKVDIHFKLAFETMDIALKISEWVKPQHDALIYLQWLQKFTPVEEKSKFELPQKDLLYPAIRDENKKALETYRTYFTDPINILAIQAAINQVNTQMEEALAKRKKMIDITDAEVLVQGNSAFAMSLYQKLCESEEGNVFFSPYSISTALAMTYAGARGNTETEMAETLRFSLGQDRLHPAFAQVESRLNKIQESGHVKLGVANSLWPQKNYVFLDNYMELIRKCYGVSITPLNYAQEPGASRIIINDWVEDKTHGKITNLLSPPDIDKLTRLVLVNAIYFKGNWERQFKAERTEDAPFHLSPHNSVQVPMMTQAENFRHANLEFFDMLELPYAGGELSMLVMLPKTHDNLTQLESNLSVENLKLWKARLGMKKVMVSFPKFKTTCRFDLIKTLKLMGIVDAFENNSDFSGMDGTTMLYITAAIHKAFIDVNEDGTEAAAATAVVVGLRGIAPPPVIFKADRPFVFLIQENATGSILFMGRVNDPTKEE